MRAVIRQVARYVLVAMLTAAGIMFVQPSWACDILPRPILPPSTQEQQKPVQNARPQRALQQTPRAVLAGNTTTVSPDSPNPSPTQPTFLDFGIYPEMQAIWAALEQQNLGITPPSPETQEEFLSSIFFKARSFAGLLLPPSAPLFNDMRPGPRGENVSADGTPVWSLAAIRAHQFPADCNNKRYLVYHMEGTEGFGRKIQVAAHALLYAMRSGRILAIGRDLTYYASPRWVALDKQRKYQPWEYWLEPVTKCQPPPHAISRDPRFVNCDAQVISFVSALPKQCFDATGLPLHPVAPIDPASREPSPKVAWRQSTAIAQFFVFRPSANSRQFIRKAAAELRLAVEQQQNEQYVGVQVRHGDKYKDRRLIAFETHLSFIQAIRDRTNSSTVFLATDDAELARTSLKGTASRSEIDMFRTHMSHYELCGVSQTSFELARLKDQEAKNLARVKQQYRFAVQATAPRPPEGHEVMARGIHSVVECQQFVLSFLTDLVLLLRSSYFVGEMRSTPSILVASLRAGRFHDYSRFNTWLLSENGCVCLIPQSCSYHCYVGHPAAGPAVSFIPPNCAPDAAPAVRAKSCKWCNNLLQKR